MNRRFSWDKNKSIAYVKSNRSICSTSFKHLFPSCRLPSASGVLVRGCWYSTYLVTHITIMFIAMAACIFGVLVTVCWYSSYSVIHITIIFIAMAACIFGVLVWGCWYSSYSVTHITIMFIVMVVYILKSIITGTFRLHWVSYTWGLSTGHLINHKHQHFLTR